MNKHQYSIELQQCHIILQKTVTTNTKKTELLLIFSVPIMFFPVKMNPGYKKQNCKIQLALCFCQDYLYRSDHHLMCGWDTEVYY